MHTRMTVLQDITETDDDIENTIGLYWENDDINLNDLYSIDYYSEVNIEQGISILRYNFDFDESDCFKYDEKSQEITITMKAIGKYFNNKIKEINEFMQDNKPVNKFVDNMYSLQLLVSPEHPKVLTTYAGLQDMIEFARSMYMKMKHFKTDKIVYKVYKCYDYHF